MDSEHARGGEHPKIIGPPTPEHKLRTVLEAVGKTVAAVEYGEVESRGGMHEAEAVVFHFTGGTHDSGQRVEKPFSGTLMGTWVGSRAPKQPILESNRGSRAGVGEFFNTLR